MEDSYVMSLSHIEKLAFVYLLINTKVNMTGIFELNDDVITLYLKINHDELRQIKAKFEKDNKFFFYENWIYVVNWHRHNKFSTLDRVLSRYVEDFEKIPATVRKYFIEVKNLGFKMPFKSDRVKLIGSNIFFNDSEMVTVKGNGYGNGNRGIDSLSIGYKDYIDPDEIDRGIQLQDALKATVHCFIGLLIVFIFGALTHKPVHAETIYITHTLTISATQSPVIKVTDHDSKSLGQTKRSLSGLAKAGGGTAKPSSVTKVVSPSPALVESVYAEFPEFKKEVARKIRDNFPQNAREMIAIAMAESGLRCEAVNAMDSNGVQAVGLFQINDGRWFTPEDIANLTNCDHNIERAKMKYRNGGLSPWGVWHTGAYLKYLWMYDQI